MRVYTSNQKNVLVSLFTTLILMPIMFIWGTGYNLGSGTRTMFGFGVNNESFKNPKYKKEAEEILNAADEAKKMINDKVEEEIRKLKQQGKQK